MYTGNTDHNTKVTNTFAAPIFARYVRLYPQAFVDAMALRADVTVCADTGVDSTKGPVAEASPRTGTST